MLRTCEAHPLFSTINHPTPLSRFSPLTSSPHTATSDVSRIHTAHPAHLSHASVRWHCFTRGHYAFLVRYAGTTGNAGGKVAVNLRWRGRTWIGRVWSHSIAGDTLPISLREPRYVSTPTILKALREFGSDRCAHDHHPDGQCPSRSQSSVLVIIY